MKYDIKFNMLDTGKATKAFATVVIDGVLEIPGFKVIEGSKGLFVGLPQTKGTTQDENGKDVYYDNIRFSDFDTESKRSAAKDELTGAVLEAFKTAQGGAKRAQAAGANAAAPTPTGGRPGAKKTPW